MFNFDGLRESLIDEIAIEFEWHESDESDDEIIVNLQNFDHSYQCSEKKNTNLSIEVQNINNVSARNYYLGRDNVTSWSKISIESLSHEQSSLLFQSAGPSDAASKAKTIEECFFFIF